MCAKFSARSCPFCGSIQVVVLPYGKDMAATCQSCAMAWLVADTPEPLAADKPAAEPPPEPLDED
jgi:hypothetical protein